MEKLKFLKTEDQYLKFEKIISAVLQIKLSTTDIYEYRVTMNKVDNFINWYINRIKWYRITIL